MVGMAVLGCGRIGRMHARNLARHPRANLVMVSDALAEAAKQTARELDVRIARRVGEVLSAADVGGVLVATPTDTHVALITAAVRAGKAVLCEKPVDLDLERARACWSEIAGNKPRVMIGFNRRFDPSFRALRERVQRGEIGTLELAAITRREPVLHFFIERYRQAYTSELDSFVSALEQGRPMSPDFGDGLQALRLAVAADESLRTGQVVELD